VYLDTTTKLKNILAEEVNDTNPTQATQDRFVHLLDRANKAIILGGGELNTDDRGMAIRLPYIFPWARSEDPIVFTTEEPISTTGSITKGSTTLTVGAVIASSVADWRVKFENSGIVYKVSAHVAGTDSITLDGAFINETQSAQDLTIFKTDYSLGAAAMAYPIGPLQIVSQNEGLKECSIVDLNELNKQFPSHISFRGIPKLAGVIKQGDGTLTLRLSHYADDPLRISLEYLPLPSDLDLLGSDTIIPEVHRMTIVHLAAYYHLRKRDDARAQSHLQSAKQLYEAMVTEARQIYGGNDDRFGRIAPFQNGFFTVGTAGKVITRF